jgi:hypothetical protein
MNNVINETIQKANDGEITFIDAYLVLHEISKQVEAAKESINKSAYDAIEKTGEKNYAYNGYVLSCGSKATYSYKHIQAWNDQKAKISEIEEKAKAALKLNLDADSKTGETIEPAIVTYSYFPKIYKQ